MVGTSSGADGRRGVSASRSSGKRSDQRLLRADRILRSSDFERIYRDGRRLTSPSFSMFVLPNSAGRSRLGLTVTRKFGNAVRRNRGKRIVREIFRKHRDAFGETLDYIINVRARADEADYASLERELVRLAAKASRTAAQ